MIDIIIILVLCVMAVIALRFAIKQKGRCSCGCQGCNMPCRKKENK